MTWNRKIFYFTNPKSKFLILVCVRS